MDFQSRLQCRVIVIRRCCHFQQSAVIVFWCLCMISEYDIWCRTKRSEIEDRVRTTVVRAVISCTHISLNLEIDSASPCSILNSMSVNRIRHTMSVRAKLCFQKRVSGSRSSPIMTIRGKCPGGHVLKQRTSGKCYTMRSVACRYCILRLYDTN